MEANTDWLELWRELVNLRKQRRAQGLLSLNQKERAEAYEEGSRRKNRERGDSLLDFIIADLRANETVLDVGAGTGRWAIPLAKVAARVTAIDPSPAMLDILRENSRASGLERKITVIQSRWEEAVVEPHDVITCAHSMYLSDDFRSFVLKISANARRRCYLSMRIPAPNGIMAELSPAIYGHQHDSPNFIIGYNALHSMGIHANVLLEKASHNWVNRDLESAFFRAKRHLLIEDSARYDDLIRKTLERRLMRRDGVYVWPDGMHSALVWWDVKH